MYESKLGLCRNTESELDILRLNILVNMEGTVVSCHLLIF